jgi:hypothetical protein
MKRHALALAAAMLVALLLTAVAATAPGDPNRKFTPADQKLARSLVLRKADLPAGAWKTAPTDFSQPNPPCVVRDYRLDSLTETGAAGYSYSLADLQVESESAVFLTASQAHRAFMTESQPGFMRCVLTSFARPGVTVRIATIERLPPTSTPVRVAADHSLVTLYSTHTNRTVIIDLVTVFLQRGRVGSGVTIARANAHVPDSLVASATARAKLNLSKL